MDWFTYLCIIMSGINKPAWAEKYKLEKDVPMHSTFEGFGTLNLSKLSIESADYMVENGFKGFVLITKPKAIEKGNAS